VQLAGFGLGVKFDSGLFENPRFDFFVVYA
jgi:hypothetical protein